VKQQGVALITVLSVLAVIATLSTATLLWQQTGLQRTEQVLHSSRMLDYMDAMAVWAETILLRDQRPARRTLCRRAGRCVWRLCHSIKA